MVLDFIGCYPEVARSVDGQWRCGEWGWEADLRWTAQRPQLSAIACCLRQNCGQSKLWYISIWYFLQNQYELFEPPFLCYRPQAAPEGGVTGRGYKDRRVTERLTCTKYTSALFSTCKFMNKSHTAQDFRIPWDKVRIQVCYFINQAIIWFT